MYEHYWKLREKPFENDQNTEFFFRSRDHREALVRLLYGIMESKCCVLLTGEPGCGKTFVLSALATELAEKKVKVAMIKNAASDPIDILRQIAQTFGVRNARATKSELIAGLEQHLGYHRERGVRAVLLIDDADLIGNERAYEELRLLMNLEHGGRPLLTIVLSGQVQLRTILQEIPGLAQRIALACSVSALGEDEALRYVEHRLDKVNGKNEIFDHRALQEVFKATGGVPRLINHLCDLALLLGACEGRDVVDARVVAKACDEFKELHQ
ncbi:ExeA family protein [Planctomycetota bacterium]